MIGVAAGLICCFVTAQVAAMPNADPPQRRPTASRPSEQPTGSSDVYRHGVLDPAPIFRELRAAYRSRILVVAAAHFDLFTKLNNAPNRKRRRDQIAAQIGLVAERPQAVFFPALKAMGLITEHQGVLELTGLGKRLATGPDPHLRDYVALEANDPGVLEMKDLLLHNGPPDKTDGKSAAYTAGEDRESPMDDPDTARYLTEALAGRAAIIAPITAELVHGNATTVLDIAGGSGYFLFDYLRRNTKARGYILDRGPVLDVAREKLAATERTGLPNANDISKRVEFVPGDMFVSELPNVDRVFAFSVLHDWFDERPRLVERFAAALNPGGSLWVHDSFLNDTLDGPIEVTDYSAQLFKFTDGCCFSRAQCRAWMESAGLEPATVDAATLGDYGLIWGKKPL